MKEKETKMCGGCCYCGGGQSWHSLLRWFLGLVIILMVFNLGVKIGEIKSALTADWSGGMMRFNQTRSFDRPMMIWHNGNLDETWSDSRPMMSGTRITATSTTR